MSILDLDMHQLMIFHYVAAEGSISMAADKLCLTQPTISYHLKSIEKYTGVKLFTIKKQRVYLTKAGQDLYQFTKEIWNQLNNIERYLNSLKQKPIRIGVTPLLHNQVAGALSKICKLHPEVNIEIISNVSVEIIRAVADMEIDVGIVMRADYKNNKVKPRSISENERLVFVVSPNNPIAKKEKVTWSDLKDYPIICGQPGSLLHELVTDRFRNAGILTPPQILVNTRSLDVLKIFVKEGNEIGLWHIKDVESDIKSGELKVLPLNEDILVPIDFITNPDNDEFLQPVIQDFIEYIKRELNQP
jgi:LysR family transcriptional regulator, low CO2-responsive transcriptional regulator